LDKTFKRYSCSHKNENGFNDDIYKYLDFILKSQLYEDNNIYNQIINLKNYPLFSLNEKMRLYVRNYFGINKNCIENKKNFALEELTELKEYFNKKFLILARTYIFIALELLLILNITVISSVNTGDKYLILFSNIVFFVVFGVIVVLNVIILFYIKEINSKLPCFDEKRKFEFLKIKQSIKKMKYLELSNLIIVSLELCVFECSQIYFFYGRRKKENEPRVLSFDRKLNIAQNNCNISNEHKNETELNNLNSQN
jgi:magnesium-transporting ATPase (P-type)